MIFALGFMISFNLIDTYFVAQLGNKPLAALTFSFPIVFLITGVAMGLGIGASAVISRAIGEGNNNLVQRLNYYFLLQLSRGQLAKEIII